MNPTDSAGPTSDMQIMCQGLESTMEQALDECQRELLVRARCFPRWVAEGRVSKSDAKDRFVRLKKACEMLQDYVDTIAAAGK